jgi:hypothetical protein
MEDTYDLWNDKLSHPCISKMKMTLTIEQNKHEANNDWTKRI